MVGDASLQPVGGGGRILRSSLPTPLERDCESPDMPSPPPEAGVCTEPAEAALGLVGLNTRPPSPPTGKGPCSAWQAAGQLAGGRDLRTSLQLHERSKVTFRRAAFHSLGHFPALKLSAKAKGNISRCFLQLPSQSCSDQTQRHVVGRSPVGSSYSLCGNLGFAAWAYQTGP